MKEMGCIGKMRNEKNSICNHCGGKMSTQTHQHIAVIKGVRVGNQRVSMN